MNIDTARAEHPEPIVTARLQRFLRSRDPRTLWPELSADALSRARREIERVVRAVLAGRADVMLPDDEGSYPLKIAAFTTGTGALLGRWIEDGRLRSSATMRTLLLQQLEQGRLSAARIEADLLPALDALRARDITPIVVKGFHTARAYCEEPGVRPLADVDLLIRPDQVDVAEATLAKVGFQPRFRRLNPYRCHWIRRDVDPRPFSIEGIDARSPWEIDLHESLDRLFVMLRSNFDGERHCVGPFGLAGRQLLAPAQPLLLLVLATQLSQELQSLRLMRLIDLVRVVRADRARGLLDWDAVLDTFRRTDSARFVYPALALAEDLAPGTIDERVLEAARTASSRTMRRAVQRLAPAGDTFDSTKVAILFMWANGPREVLKMLAGLAVREIRLGPRHLLVRLRVLLRHLASGAFTFAAPDERHRGTTPPRRPTEVATGDADAVRR